MALWNWPKCPQYMQRTWWQTMATQHTGIQLLYFLGIIHDKSALVNVMRRIHTGDRKLLTMPIKMLPCVSRISNTVTVCTQHTGNHLTNRGPATHGCHNVNKRGQHLPVWRQAIIWINVVLLLIAPLGTILVKWNQNTAISKQINVKISFAKWQLSFLSLPQCINTLMPPFFRRHC